MKTSADQILGNSLGLRGRFQLFAIPALTGISAAGISADFPVCRWLIFAFAVGAAGYLWYKDGRTSRAATYASLMLVAAAFTGLVFSYYLPAQHAERDARNGSTASTMSVR